jgi:Divergent InlB B-repeat domain
MPSHAVARAAGLIVASLLFSSQLALAQFSQQGPKLVGSGAVGDAGQGYSVALSADANTAIVGGIADNSYTGAAWVFTRSNGVWTQQGGKLVGTGAVGSAAQGYSVALSGDGNTAIVGGPDDNSLTGGSAAPYTGATWVYTRSGGVWTPQGNKLVGTGAVGDAYQGWSVGLSGDGNTAILGGYADNNYIGAAWVFTRSGGVWTQQGGKLLANDAVESAYQGFSVGLSADGNTAIVGGPDDNPMGAAWVYTRSGGVWSQQGSKLVGTGGVGPQGRSVALSGDGHNAIVGGAGAAWVFVQQSLQVTPTTDIVAAGNPGGPFAPSSFQYQLSATFGSINYSISGVPNWLTPSATSGTASPSGTAVTFTVNANANSLAVGTYGPITITFANSDTGQGTQTRTATLTVNPPGLQVTPATGITASGTHGGPFSPSSFRYELSATYGSVKYSITTPNWLTASPESGTVTTSAKTITFIVNASARNLQPDTYINSINFYNTTNNQGNTTRVATLIVNPKPYKLTVDASPSADGTVSGGGEVPEGSSTTVTATAKTGHTFVHWTDAGKVVSTAASYMFTMPSANVTLVAHFQ